MRIFFTLLISSLIFTQPLKADDLSQVKEIVTTNITMVIDYVKDKNLSKELRNQKIIDAVIPFFDFEVMAKLCLGKKHWIAMNKAQRQEFVDLFVKRLQESYLEKLDLYTDEEVVIEKAKKVKRRIHVITYLVSKDDRMEMVYKFKKTRNKKTKEIKWLVYDIEILGVSIVQTYRSQFSGILKDQSIEQLLDQLRVKDSLKIPTDGTKS